MSREQRILEMLRKRALNIEGVAGATGMSRITASKYLAILEAKGLVHHSEEGRSKLYSVTKK
ncbi:MAG: winged helix-turn-helix transcriptional regulator [Candidatus Aenigmarchaeota archaeon]|nr:winged helix-turn-helix transcriptional regulator [Candidatus Aenigmarchaeota archaeon]